MSRDGRATLRSRSEPVLLKTTAGVAVVAKLQAGGAKADVFFPTIDVLGKNDPLHGSVGFPNSHERLR
jgi:hypothetical protein